MRPATRLVLFGLVLLGCHANAVADDLAPAVARAPGRGARAAGAGAALQQVPLPHLMRDNFGGTWDVQQDGSIGDGANDLFDGGGSLLIGGNPYVWEQPTVGFDAARNELVFPPAPMMGLNVSRRISVNAKGGWCRWVDVLENTNAAPIKLQVQIHFDLGNGVQAAQEIADPRKKRPMALAIFDGNQALGMVGAGRGAKLAPRFQPQPNSDQVDLYYDVEVPAKGTVAIVHVHVLRPTMQQVTQAVESLKDRDYLAGLPKEVLKQVVNFSAGERTIGEAEVLRGGIADVVELRGGDQYRGTIKNTSYKLNTFYGPLELPADRVVAMMTVGVFRPSQLLVTADGEVFGGELQAAAIELQLSSGQLTSVPLANVTRLGYRKRAGEPEEWKFEQPFVFLRDGQRIAVKPPGGTIPVSTIYGPIELKPESVAALVFQGEEQSVHQVLLADGSRFAALIGKDKFDLQLGGAAAGSGSVGAKTVTFPAASVARLQFAAAPEEPGDDTPTLSLTNGDLMIGALAGELLLETGFDTIRISGPEVRGLRHVEQPPDSPPGSPSEVQVTLWDQATLSGRLKGDVVECLLKSGTPVKIPVALVKEYGNPEPLPGKEMIDRIRAVVLELSHADWRHRDRAAAQLLAVGPPAASVLKSMRDGQPPEAQRAIDELLTRFEESKRSGKGPAHAPPAGDLPGIPAPAEAAPDVQVEIEVPPAPPPPPDPR